MGESILQEVQEAKTRIDLAMCRIEADVSEKSVLLADRLWREAETLEERLNELSDRLVVFDLADEIMEDFDR